MGTQRAALGRRGEGRAVRYLESLGYEIVERNYRCRHGEIDVIARDGGDLAFVEVKTRRTDEDGCPSAAVDLRKRRRIVLSAWNYLQEKDLGEIDCRFDVAEVYFVDGRRVRVDLIKGAFSADEAACGEEI